MGVTKMVTANNVTVNLMTQAIDHDGTTFTVHKP
jgi:aspartokinase